MSEETPQIARMGRTATFVFFPSMVNSLLAADSLDSS